MAKPKAKPETKTDPLERVVEELKRRNTSQVSRDTELPLRTVTRIKLDRENDPRYSSVRRLFEYLFS